MVFPFSSHSKDGTLGSFTGASVESQRAAYPFDSANHSWLGVTALAAAIGIAYFMAARLGLALRSQLGVAFFWPAVGIAVGALIALGPGARFPLAAGVVVATAVANLMIGRNAWLAIVFGLVNAGQTLLTAWEPLINSSIMAHWCH